jgi:hypothetical protein
MLNALAMYCRGWALTNSYTSSEPQSAAYRLPPGDHL